MNITLTCKIVFTWDPDSPFTLRELTERLQEFDHLGYFNVISSGSGQLSLIHTNQFVSAAEAQLCANDFLKSIIT